MLPCYWLGGRIYIYIYIYINLCCCCYKISNWCLVQCCSCCVTGASVVAATVLWLYLTIKTVPRTILSNVFVKALLTSNMLVHHS